MTKHNWRESLKSLFGHHVDPERDEQLKGIKTEIDEKVKKILTLVESGDLEENESKKEAVSELVKEFYEQYQLLYNHYDHLTGEIRKKVHGKRENESSSSSSSDSDSDDSSKRKNKKNGRVDNEFKEITNEMKQEIETANLEVGDLKGKLATVIGEKEALDSEYQTALRKIKEGEQIIRNSKLVAEKLDGEKSKLSSENLELHKKLETAGKIEADLNQMLEDINREKNDLATEKEDLKTTADQLKAENANLQQQIGTLREEASVMRSQLESAEEKVSDLSDGLNASEEENKSLSLKVSEILNEIQLAQNATQELTTASSLLKEELSKKEREFSAVSDIHEVHEKESSDQIKCLEAKAIGLELELESLRAQNRDIELQIASKTSEAEQLAEQNKGLVNQISELELSIKKRGNKLSVLTKKLEDNENKSLSRIENLTAEINNLRAEMNSLSVLKEDIERKMASSSDEASSRTKELKDEVSALQEELGFVHSQKTELEHKLEKKSQEISEYLIKMENFEQEIVKKSGDEERILLEQNSLLEKLRGLELELESLDRWRSELEEQLRTKVEENGRLGEENLGIRDKILEMERVIAEKDLELSALHEKQIEGENELSAQTTALTEQINNLKRELHSLQTHKNEMELELEKEKQEKTALLNQINDQQRISIEQEAAYNKLTEEYKHVEALFKEQEGAFNKQSEEHRQASELLEEYKTKLEAAERKVEEMTEELSKNNLSKDQTVTDLEDKIESLSNELEMKEDEISTLLQKVSNIEVNHRLTNQKLRVTEQVLTEKEESFKKQKEKYLEEQRELEERISKLSGVITATHEAYQGMIKDISKRVTMNLNGLEMVVQRFGEKCQNYEKCIVEASKELWAATNWIIEANHEKEGLKKEAYSLSQQLETKREQESTLREKVEKLEIKASREEKQNANLSEALKQLEKKTEVLEKMVKEKDEGMSDLSEEKREAIRQLCVWIDYHKGRYDYLKDGLSKMVAARGQRRA